MKYLILLLISFNAFAECKLSIPVRDVERALNPPVVGHYLKCEDFPQDECICIDKANTWYSELADEIVNGAPIYSEKSNVTPCDSEEACKALGENLCANPADFFWSKNLLIGFGEAYCASIVGYEQVKTGKKILKENPEKKAQYLAKIEAEKLAEKSKQDAKKAALERIKAFEPKGSTILQLRQEVKQLADDMKEVLK